MTNGQLHRPSGIPARWATPLERFSPHGPRNLKGSFAIGHNRYSTAGGSRASNIQPIFADLAGGGLAIAHNGNLTNAHTLRQELVGQGAIFQSPPTPRPSSIWRRAAPRPASSIS
jgi:glutamate synthase domain-containing protein 1